MEEASFLTKYGSKVYIIHRRDELRASKIMQAKSVGQPPRSSSCGRRRLPKPSEQSTWESMRVKNLKTDEEKEIPVAGLFFAIGHIPNTKFLNGQLDTDDQDYLVTKPDSTKTNIDGVFAAGDVQDKKWRQAITAAGTGCMAALEAEHFLASL